MDKINSEQTRLDQIRLNYIRNTARSGRESNPNLRVGEFFKVWREVVKDAVTGSWQSDPSDQQDGQHQVGEQRREVNHLGVRVVAERIIGGMVIGGRGDWGEG